MKRTTIYSQKKLREEDVVVVVVMITIVPKNSLKSCSISSTRTQNPEVTLCAAHGKEQPTNRSRGVGDFNPKRRVVFTSRWRESGHGAPNQRSSRRAEDGHQSVCT